MISFGANVYMYRLYRQAHTPNGAAIQPLKAGAKVPVLKGKALDGSPVSESFNKRTVLYFFSPTCSWCERNLANARAVAAGAGDQYRFVAVAPFGAGVAEYDRQRGLGWTVVTDVPADIVSSYKVMGTPHTMLVDAGGVVLGNWSGAYSDEAVKDVELKLGITLPGLVASK